MTRSSVAAGGNLWLRSQRWMYRRTSGWTGESGPAHLETGVRGEAEALFELRRRGYVVVARRWRTVKLRGDVDLIAWDGDRLCFIEVKTRTMRGLVPAEFAVDEAKREMLRSLARAYVKALQDDRRAGVQVRFDVVAVYLLENGVEFEVYRGAFAGV